MKPASKIDWNELLCDFDGIAFADEIAMNSNGFAGVMRKAALAKTPQERTEHEAAAEKLRVKLTLGRACRNALVTTVPDEKITDNEKFERGLLALSIAKNEVEVLDDAEVLTLKKCLAYLYGPAVLVRVFPKISPEAATKAAAQRVKAAVENGADPTKKVKAVKDAA